MKKHDIGRQKQKRPDWREWLQNMKACQAAYDAYLKKGMLRPNPPKAELHLRKATHNLDFGGWVSDRHAVQSYAEINGKHSLQTPKLWSYDGFVEELSRLKRLAPEGGKGK